MTQKQKKLFKRLNFGFLINNCNNDNFKLMGQLEICIKILCVYKNINFVIIFFTKLSFGVLLLKFEMKIRLIFDVTVSF